MVGISRMIETEAEGVICRRLCPCPSWIGSRDWETGRQVRMKQSRSEEVVANKELESFHSVYRRSGHGDQW